jgi:hypothetical protein
MFRYSLTFALLLGPVPPGVTNIVATSETATARPAGELSGEHKVWYGPYKTKAEAEAKGKDEKNHRPVFIYVADFYETDPGDENRGSGYYVVVYYRIEIFQKKARENRRVRFSYC